MEFIRKFSVYSRKNLFDGMLGSGYLNPETAYDETNVDNLTKETQSPVTRVALHLKNYKALATPEVYESFDALKSQFDEPVDIWIHTVINGQCYPLGVF